MSPVVVVVIAFRVHCNAFRVLCKLGSSFLLFVFNPSQRFSVSSFCFFVTLFGFIVRCPSRRILNHNFGYVFGFGEGELLTDLGLALVDGLETLTSEHVDLLG